MEYKIGDFSRISRVSVRALRYYDEIGLLKPIRVDRNTGYRYYSLDQLPKLNRINMLKGIGLSLEDINGLLREGLPADHIRQLLTVKKSEIETRINQDAIRRRQVEIWLEKINREGQIPEESYIQRKAIPSVKVISKREIGTYDETTPKLYGELMALLDLPGNTEMVTVTGPFMGLYYDDEYKEADADIEAAFPISGGITVSNDGFEVKILPEIDVISTVYKGPSYEIHGIYAQIMEYAEKHSLKLQTPLRELYFDYPEKDPDEGLLIEIQFPYEESII